MDLEGCVETVAEAPEEVKKRLEVAVESLNEVIRSTRDYIMDLRPDALAEKKLCEYLEALGEEFSRNTPMGIELQVDFEEDPGLTSSQIAQLLAIAREGLTNVVKHASARSIVLGLSRVDGFLRLWVRDDGVGFDPKGHGCVRGQGLRNMRERAEALGGHLLIESSSGHGTRLEAVLPLEGRERAFVE